MNVSSIKREIRDIGPNYGLPVTSIQLGFGTKYTDEEILSKVSLSGFNIGGWIVIKGSPSGVGLGSLVKVLKIFKAKIEIEDDGSKPLPNWFSEADRWIVNWSKDSPVVYTALRARQDMILIDSLDLLEEFYTLNIKNPCLKGLVGNYNVEAIWPKLKGTDVRFYFKE